MNLPLKDQVFLLVVFVEFIFFKKQVVKIILCLKKVCSDFIYLQI